ncbi:CPBP family glutamic-type intramembrane protease [Staphylococcus agnetis]|uniref:CPBP family glutamic-type intramembrane protease n=1 Tax=Staphylococcus agnetis TaxID=985762 RepID=UPI0016496777
MSIVLMILDLNKDHGMVLISFVTLNYLIAWEEEFLYRLIIPKILSKLFSSIIIICCIQSVIFSFIGHPEYSLLSSLVYRVPLSIVLYYLAHRFKNIYCATSVHSIWNIIIHYL